MIGMTNYETWFLLYADNELTADEREAVLSFVKQHPSLKQEFDGILELRFLPDTEQQKMDKSLLRSNVMESRVEKSFEDNEILLDHIDGELSRQSAKELNHRLNQDLDLQATYNELQKLKFEPDAMIVYPDRSELYKHDQTAYFPWRWSIAMAASLLVAAGLFWILSNNSNTTENSVALTKKQDQRTVLDKKSSVENKVILSQVLIPVNKKKQKVDQASLASSGKKSLEAIDLVSSNSPTEPILDIEERVNSIVEPSINASNSKSNNLPTQQVNLVSNTSTDPALSTETIFVDSFDETPTRSGRKPFKQLFRKIGRVLGREREESDQVKFIQVANIQFAVSKQ